MSMVFTIRAWVYGLISACVAAAVIASLLAIFEPGAGDPGALARPFVESAVDWFLPVLALIAPFTVLGFAWREQRRPGRDDCPDCE